VRIAALSLLLALLTAAAFAPALDDGFVSLDDPAVVTDNPRVLQGLGVDGLRWALTSREAANWHPLTWASHMLDVDLYGTSPRGHHLTNVALHAAATVAFFLFLAGATGAALPSFLAAALFGLHPLRVESVAWVAERKDVLAAALWMLALLAYLRHARRPGAARFAAVFALVVLGLAAKPTLLALPAVLLVVDLWPLGRRRSANPAAATPWRTLLAEKALLALPVLGALALTLDAQRGAGTIAALPLASRVANAFANHLDYLGLLAWPSRLYIPRLLPEGGAAPLAAVAGAALVAGACAAAWRWRRRAPFAAAGWAWYLLAFVPMIGLVQLVNQSVADRYTYLPSAGLAIAVAWGAAAAATGPRSRRVVGGAAVLLLAVLLAASRAQTRVWKDDVTLFGHAAALDPGNPAAALNLGTALMNEGSLARAEAVLRGLLAREPGFVPGRLRLGGVLLELGRPAEAVAVLAPAASREPLNVALRVRLGLALARAGRPSEARGHLETALRLRPRDPDALAALAELDAPPQPSPSR
jgi:tetratricopeptide (TPR) repeat protein